MTLLSKLLLLLFVMTADAAHALEKTFEEFVEGALIIGEGVCVTKQKTYFCRLINKGDQEYFVYYQDNKPCFITRRTDGKVIWVAVTGVDV